MVAVSLKKKKKKMKKGNTNEKTIKRTNFLLIIQKLISIIYLREICEQIKEEQRC